MQVCTDNYLEQVRQLLADAREARLAVAFWGEGAAEALGLPSTQAKLRVVCNLLSGGSNPEEIERLCAFDHIEMRHHAQMHAKVFWTPHAMIAGSANASANGLALEGAEQSAWREYGLCTRERPVLEATEAWFERLWDEALPVLESDLRRAMQRYRTRRIRRAPRPRLSLLQAIRSNPETFRDPQLWFAIYPDEDWTATEKDLIDLAQRQHGDPEVDGYLWEGLTRGHVLVDLAYSDRTQRLLLRRMQQWHLLGYVGNSAMMACREDRRPRHPLSRADKRLLQAHSKQLIAAAFAESRDGLLSPEHVCEIVFDTRAG